MAVVSVASHKGGVGKTTLAILLGTDLALDGYKVALLDCDLNQHAAAFSTKADLKNFSVVPEVGEGAILPAIREASAAADIVLVDLPGGSSTLALKALQRSNFVLVPCQASLPDVRDAVRTMEQIADAQDLSGHTIARALIWTRLLPGFESRAAKHVRESLEGMALPMFATAQRELALYREMHMTGEVPRQRAPGSPAARNVSAITAELLAALQTLSVAA